MTLDQIARAWRMKRLQIMQDAEEQRDREQQRADRIARSLPPDDEDEELEAAAAEVFNTMPLVPDVPEPKHVFENMDMDRMHWEFLRAWLVRHEAQQRDVRHALQKIATNLEKITMEQRR